MFLDISVMYRWSGPEFASREVHDFGLLRVEGDTVRRSPAHHLVDGPGSHSRSFVYCVAYGQDGCVIGITKAALGVAQSVDGLCIEQEKNRRYRRPLREAALERRGGCEGVLISDTGRSATHEGSSPSSEMVRPSLFTQSQHQSVAQDGVERALDVHCDQGGHLFASKRL